MIPGRGIDRGGLPHLWGGGYTYSAGEYVYAWFGIPDGEYLFFGGLPRPQGREGRGHLCGVFAGFVLMPSFERERGTGGR
jgi:hypothetical protein